MAPQDNGTAPSTDEPEEIQLNSEEVTKIVKRKPGSDPLAHVASDMPPVQQHAIDAERKKEADAAAQTQQMQETAPGFDPAIHEVKDGQPVLTKDGKPRRKRGGASKLKGLPKPGLGGPSPAPENVEQTQAGTNAEFKAAAAVATELTVQAGCIAFGPAGQPRYQKIADGQVFDEREGLNKAYFDYFKAKGISDIPPGLALCVVVLGYGIARFQMPEAQPRIAKWRGWIYGMYAKWKAWRQSPKAAYAVPTAEREENPDSEVPERHGA